MAKCTVIEQGVSYVIETNDRGEIPRKTEIPYPVAAAVLAAIAEQQQQVLYDRGVATKTNSGMYPKSIW